MINSPTWPAALTPRGPSRLSGQLSDLAAAFAGASRAQNTVAAYGSDWRRFLRWCQAHGRKPLPAEASTVADYLAEAATAPGLSTSRRWRYATATLARWVAAINKAHHLAGVREPGRDALVQEVLAGVRRSRATPPARKSPLLMDDIERVVAGIPMTWWPQAVAGVRDRALLVMGWVGAFRRSELTGLFMADVTLHPEDGLHVRLRQSKTDPEAHGMVRALPHARRRPLLCAPCAFVAWARLLCAWDATDGGPGGRVGAMKALHGFAEAGNDVHHLCARPDLPGLGPEQSAVPLFRAVRPNGAIAGALTGHAVNAVVKRRAAAVGFNPAGLGGHSLRAGFVTAAYRAGANAHSIMRQTGHRDVAMLEIYAREHAPLVNNAVMELGL